MLMILQVYNEKYLDDIMMALTEAEIDNSLVLSGESLGHKLAFDMPLFAGFRQTMGKDKSYAKVIIAEAKEKDIDFLLEELLNSGVDFIKEEIGKIFLLPIHKMY